MLMCIFKIIPPRRVVEGLQARRNVNPQDQEVPNTPEVQPPQEDVTNVKFKMQFKC